MPRSVHFPACATLACLFLATLAGCGRIKPADEEATNSGPAPASAAVERYPDDDQQAPSDIEQVSYNVESADPFHASLRALEPLQVLVGAWQGVTVKAIGGAKAAESPQWNWDFLSKPDQPTLVLTSKSSPYLRLARLTYRPERRVYELFVTSSNGSERIYEGKFTQKPQQTGAQSAAQTSFQLRFDKTTPQDKQESLVFKVQNNSRYLLEVYRPTGNELALYDTVETTRDSRAETLVPRDAGSRSCVVSGGSAARLPLIYEGKEYFVCCDGCKSAFMADPQRWVDESQARNRR